MIEEKIFRNGLNKLNTFFPNFQINYNDEEIFKEWYNQLNFSNNEIYENTIYKIVMTFKTYPVLNDLKTFLEEGRIRH